MSEVANSEVQAKSHPDTIGLGREVAWPPIQRARPCRDGVGASWRCYHGRRGGAGRRARPGNMADLHGNAMDT